MNGITQLLLLRHAEVEERYHRVFGGRIDMDLSPRGHEQARRLAAHMRRHSPAALYVSPMRRARQTVAPFTGDSQPAPIILDDLREVDFGAWTDQTWEQVFERFQARPFDWLEKLEAGAIPEAEAVQAFRDRVCRGLTRILRDNASRRVAVVSHGGVIRMMLALLLDLPLRRMSGFDIDYASLTWVDCQPARAEVRLLNYTPWRDV